MTSMTCTTLRLAGTMIALAIAASHASAGVCPSQGNCYEPHETPGCSSTSCCGTVCDQDPFCCESSWDGICVDLALDLCGQCGDPDNGSCFAADFTPGCQDEACCATVCAADSFCCNNSWDDLCANQAATLCAGCGQDDAGSCFEDHGTPACEDETCCVTICAADVFCCESSWDGICVEAAFDLCGGCGDPDSGDCFEPDDTPGCEDLDCCTTVCFADSFCCANHWDSLCASEAADLCGGCGGPDAGSCFDADDAPGCGDFECCQTVCAFDNACCLVAWDFECVTTAISLCEQCGGEGSGGCFVVHEGTGCNLDSCCEKVCLQDLYCCGTQWDSICVDGALAVCCGSECLGDFNGDGDVDGGDLGVLLADFNRSVGCTDLDGSGLVDGGDLGLLLGAFGECP